LTEPFGISDDYFGPLDLTLAHMDLTTVPTGYERGLEEHDFLNSRALEDVDSSMDEGRFVCFGCIGYYIS